MHRTPFASDAARPATAAGARNALLAAVFVLMLVATIAANPYSAHASTLQLHGALSRPGGLGIIAHRGAAAIAPENTLAALRISFSRGIDFVEVDLHLTSDGVPVLMHDATLDRTTNGHGKVAKHTLAEIKALDAGGWFGPAYAGEPVPTLGEFLDVLRPTTSRALVELKGHWKDEQVLAAVAQLRERHLVNRVAFESFDLGNLERLSRLAPEFARVMLTPEWDEQTLDLAIRLGVSAVGARYTVFANDFDLIVRARALGIGTMVYTLNLPQTWEAARHFDIDLVITDNPVALENWRDAQAPMLRSYP